MSAYPLDEDKHNVDGHHQVAWFREITDFLGGSLLELGSNFGDFGGPCALTIYTPQSTRHYRPTIQPQLLGIYIRATR